MTHEHAIKTGFMLNAPISERKLPVSVSKMLLRVSLENVRDILASVLAQVVRPSGCPPMPDHGDEHRCTVSGDMATAARMDTHLAKPAMQSRAGATTKYTT